jgi:tryptophan 2,3-dioxygenase
MPSPVPACSNYDLSMSPIVWALAIGFVGVVVLRILAWMWTARREAAARTRRREELKRAHGFQYMQQQEVERLASQIQATSSTGTIAGYEILRQIEAVFVDNQPSPARAVEFLKAHAAEKGANALIHLATDRSPGGKCIARADAVIVRTLTPPSAGV